MGSQRLPLPEEIDAIGVPLMSEDGAVGPIDINKVIRLNLEYLEIQQVIHQAEAIFSATHGEDWADKFKLSSLSAIAKSFPLQRAEIVEAIRTINEDPNFLAAGENLEFPRLSVKKTAELTGINESRLEDIRKEARLQGGVSKHGKPFLVEELIALANAHNTTLAFLLTPPIGFVGKGATNLNFEQLTHSSHQPVPFSRWVLWLHNLKSLPAQNAVLFERILSASSWAKVNEKNELKQPNSKPSQATTKAALKRERLSEFSCYSELENYEPLSESELVDVGVNPPKVMPADFDSEIELTMTNMGTFVELRKLFREHNLIRKMPDRSVMVSIANEKVANGFSKVFMLLRERTLFEITKTKPKR